MNISIRPSTDGATRLRRHRGLGSNIWIVLVFAFALSFSAALIFPAASAQAQTADPFSAQFLSVPDSHDGSDLTFELRFSEPVNGLSYVVVRDSLLDADGGEVMKAKRIVSGSNQRWRITLRPNSDSENVVVTLSRGTEVATGYTMANEVTATVSAATDEAADETPADEAVNEVPEPVAEKTFSAEFLEVPFSHNGSDLTFELRFSESINDLSYVVVRDSLLDADGGEVMKAKRIVSGSNQRWRITLRPNSDSENVVVTLSRGTEVATGYTMVNDVTATIRVVAMQMDTSTSTATVTFSGAPSNHEGCKVSINMALSENISGITAADVEDMLSVTNGRVLDVVSTSSGNNKQYWRIDAVATLFLKFGITVAEDTAIGSSGYTVESEATVEVMPHQ